VTVRRRKGEGREKGGGTDDIIGSYVTWSKWSRAFCFGFEQT